MQCNNILDFISSQFSESIKFFGYWQNIVWSSITSPIIVYIVGKFLHTRKYFHLIFRGWVLVVGKFIMRALNFHATYVVSSSLCLSCFQMRSAVSYA